MYWLSWQLLSICQFVNLSIWPQCLKILRAHRRAQPTQPDNIAVSTFVDVLIEEIIWHVAFYHFLRNFKFFSGLSRIHQFGGNLLIGPGKSWWQKEMMLEYKQILEMLDEAWIEKQNLMGLYKYRYTELKSWIKHNFFCVLGNIFSKIGCLEEKDEISKFKITLTQIVTNRQNCASWHPDKIETRTLRVLS